MKEKIVIIGGVAGGASAAARLRRLSEECEIKIFERGDYISYANCGLPYHIGGAIPDRRALLLQTPQRMKERYNVDVKVHHEVTQILPQEKKVKIRDLTSGQEFFESYDKLVIATGSSPIVPPIPGIDLPGIFQVWTVPDTDRIKEYLAEHPIKRAAVIGGGFIGLEMAENLHALGLDVSIVEMADQVMAPLDYEMAKLLHSNIQKNNVSLLLGDGVKEFQKTQEGLRIVLASGAALETDMVILAIGVRPNSKIAADAGIALNARGGIIVDAGMRTGIQDIFAVGDVVEVEDFVDGERTMIPLAGPANKQGRLAADNLLGAREEYAGTQGTSIAKVFDLCAAATGHNEKQLQKQGKIKGKDYDTVMIVQNSHATYYPGAKQMFLKLIYEMDTGRLLGGQAVGSDGVDKRIDALSIAMRFGGGVDDLTRLEIAYAPPFASAKDAVNMLGFVAQNARRGLVKFVPWNITETKEENMVLLDVRTPGEYAEFRIPGAVNIPLDELRSRLGELEREKHYVVICAVGVRAYLAARILSNNAFPQVSIYPGGMTYYRAIQ
ncbi:FAD-dependent oxidoreductase [Youxingia wuxianensis]|uniref:FAD-dependent oxidoreductase n=1 Tax=Youxingia wuxianensis TaxID=2763678 RepID=A0A926ESC4_9FIRM|nr:FAD-dependent oxidoreductase [Youxingia wuxianensis]MBC8585727.1 FAD-dependent oxidoreductase [Youxingia wuxianensis]